MATRIATAADGRKSVFCDITGLGFTRMGDALEAYTVTYVSERLAAPLAARKARQQEQEFLASRTRWPQY